MCTDSRVIFDILKLRLLWKRNRCYQKCAVNGREKELFGIHAIIDITKNTRVFFLYFDSSSYLDVLKEFSGRPRYVGTEQFKK